MINTKIELVTDLNQELFEATGETELKYSYSTNGTVEIIEFDGHILWCSDSDFDEETQTFEEYLKQEFTLYQERLADLKL